jgi:Do/DeqQ family serine protease
MNKRDKALSAILILLIGVLLGMILMFFRQGSLSLDFAEVRVTEINRSEMPYWSNEELEKIDDRFIFRTVAKSVTPTVVYIETIVPVRNRGIEEDSEEDNQFWERFMPPRARTVGSGVLISEDGYVLTNNHVVADAVKDEISVTLEDKRTFSARIVGQDPSTDLAVVKVDGRNLPSATIGDSDKLQVGEWVLAVGNPFRLRSTITAGIISALSRDVQIINDELRIESFIQTDAAINRGNSGGALVNTSGELIGINTAIATQSGNYQGYGFAVPSNLALKVAKDLIEFGDVKRGLLGVTIESVDESTARSSGLDRIEGVRIVNVIEGGAADIAGIQRSDIILRVNDEPVSESNQLQEKVAMFRPEDEISLSIWRDGDIVYFDVTLQELQRPDPEQLSLNEPQIEQDDESWEEIPENGREFGIEQQSFDDPGFTLRSLSTPEDPEEFDIYIIGVDRGSEAWNRGVREGGRILEINGQKVTDMDMVRNEITDSQINSRSLNLEIETEEGSTGFYKLN